MTKIIKLSSKEDIARYEPSPALKVALEMAISLGRPLLLAGKPGTGKTQFAHWYVGNEENKKDHNEVFQFNTKSTSLYSELFYEYDAVSHFRDKSEDKDVTDFITLTALGKAIVCAKGFVNIDDERLKKIAMNSEIKEELIKPKSVVLIDEIDKAPRDFPNDLLHEIENLSFTIKEALPSIKVKLEDKQKENIIVILSSNDEKNLPDAFLRRCLFHYIEFPDADQLKKIILRKLSPKKLSEEELKEIDINTLKGFEGVNDKIDIFYKILKSDSIDKKPYTSECLDWVNYLHDRELLSTPIGKCRDTLAILLKKDEDYKEALKVLEINEA
jgi:MoxR-like ATPase